MEVFAQAALCKKLEIPLLSVKYVTDIIGKNSVSHWQEKLEHAHRDLQEYFEHITLFKN